MNPNDIELKDLSKVFEYERMSREIDNCNDIKEIKEKSKYVLKLYFSTLETFKELGIVIEK